jgi:hypothetical protein
VAVEREALLGPWLHAHEEDTGAEQVFRRPSHPFPRSRGRSGFELLPDGALVERGPGPTDAPTEGRGTWELQADELVLRGAGGLRTLVVVAAEGDRLVVRPHAS